MSTSGPRGHPSFRTRHTERGRPRQIFRTEVAPEFTGLRVLGFVVLTAPDPLPSTLCTSGVETRQFQVIGSSVVDTGHLGCSFFGMGADRTVLPREYSRVVPSGPDQGRQPIPLPLPVFTVQGSKKTLLV